MTSEQGKLPLDFEENPEQSPITTVGWIARSFESMEEWKKRGREVFLSVGGNSDVARNRVAAIIRDYFVNTPPTSEDVKKWNKGSTEIETVHVTPPKISAANATYVDWLYAADYILLACASPIDEHDAENQRRETEYRQAYDSYKIRTAVYDAVSLVQEFATASEDDLLGKLKKKHKGASIAHIKEAKQLVRNGVRCTPPKAPNLSPLPRFTPIYFQ